MGTFLRTVKETGEIPEDHKSHDHLNEQKDIPIDREVRDKWTARFQKICEEADRNGEELVWGILDGFLLYWHPVGPFTLQIREHCLTRAPRTCSTH